MHKKVHFTCFNTILPLSLSPPCRTQWLPSSYFLSYCVLRIEYCVLRIEYCVLRIEYCVLRIEYCVRTNKGECVPPLTLPAIQYTKHTPCPSTSREEARFHKYSVSDESEVAFSCLNLPCRPIPPGRWCFQFIRQRIPMEKLQVPF